MGLGIPIPHAVAIVTGALYGLHAAHEATSERGEALSNGHRDVSPQNILVGADGLARALDFGVAKAAGRLQTTPEGQLKGKMAYMAPEQLRGGKLDRRTDVFAAGVVLWEALTGTRLFSGDSDVAVFGKVLAAPIDAPSTQVPEVPPALDAVVMKALDRSPDARFATAHELARALEKSCPVVVARGATHDDSNRDVAHGVWWSISLHGRAFAASRTADALPSAARFDAPLPPARSPARASRAVVERAEDLVRQHAEYATLTASHTFGE